jgi:hypothetical protein
MQERQIIKEIGSDQIGFYFSLGREAEDTFKVDIVREDFERAYFCAVRALRHLKFKKHNFMPLKCDGCKEVALFLTEPGYRGDEHNPIGTDCERSY